MKRSICVAFIIRPLLYVYEQPILCPSWDATGKTAKLPALIILTKTIRGYKFFVLFSEIYRYENYGNTGSPFEMAALLAYLIG